MQWIPVQTIMSTSFDLALQPYSDPTLGYGDQGSAYRLNGDANQYFLVTSHNGSSIWETYWPTEGILVWRVNSNDWVNPLWGRANRYLQIESASGDWAWDSVGMHIDTVGSWINYLTIAVRTDTADAAGGYDSLDFRYTLRADTESFMFAQQAGYLGWGGVGQFFTEGMSMDDYTNPTTRLRVDQAPDYPRTVNSGVALRNIRETAQHNFVADLVVNAWQGTMTQSHTWYDTITVIGNLTVASGAALTILPGTVIQIYEGVTIAVEGSINASGTVQEPIVFRSAPVSNPLPRWGGLRLYGLDTTNVLEYVEVHNAEWGIVVTDGHVRIENCEIDDCEYGIICHTATGSIRYNEVHDCDYFGVYVMNGAVHIENNTIAHNGQGGVRLIRGDHRLAHNAVSENGHAHYASRVPWSGIEILGAFSILSCNEIFENEGPGLFVYAGGYADMDHFAWNEVYDNMLGIDSLPDPYDYGQIHFQGGFASLFDGTNSIYDQTDEGRLIWNSLMDSVSVLMSGNYWGTTDSANIADRLMPFSTFTPFLDRSYACLNLPPDSSDEDEDLLLFNQGWDQEFQGLFAVALATYDSLVDTYPESKLADAALERISFCEEALGWTWDEIRQYFQELAADTLKDTYLGNQCLTTAAWAAANMLEFETAIDELEALADTSTKEEDIIRAQLVLLMAELKQNNDIGLFRHSGDNRELGRGAGLDSDVPQMAITSDESLRHFTQRVDELLAQTCGQKHKPSILDNATLPTRYALYQNYPNPFNPLTEIRFDLPEQARVALTIFNTLGQRVATLIDEPRVAGTYRVQWDGSSVASGVYLYQLKAGNFVGTKKLILLK